MPANTRELNASLLADFLSFLAAKKIGLHSWNMEPGGRMKIERVCDEIDAQNWVAVFTGLSTMELDALIHPERRKLENELAAEMRENARLREVIAQHEGANTTVEMERYFIGHDDSGHDYFVPVSRKAEWESWCAIPSDDERSWEVPEYAEHFESELTFTSPSTD